MPAFPLLAAPSPTPRTRRLALCIAIALALVPASADAQERKDNAAPGEITLPSVRVKGETEGARAGYSARSSNSALGLELARRDIPQSVSVLDRALIEDFALTSVNDLLSLAPGVSVERVETDRTYYTARGFDIQTFQFDGVGMPFANGAQWGDLDTVLYERVDVLRGANGLLTATGNPSATINFVRKRPTAEFRASAAATLGSWDKQRVEGDISGSLGADARARLIVAREQRDSYLDRYAQQKTVVAGNVDIDLGAATVLNLGYSEQRKDTDSPLWGALPLTYSDGSRTDYDVSTSTAADWSFWDNEDRSAHAELQHELGGGWLAQVSLLQRELESDSELFYVYGLPDKTTGAGSLAYPSAFSGSYTQKTADIRVSGPVRWGEREHELLAGFNWGHEKARERSDYGRGIGAAVPDLANWNGDYAYPVFDAGVDGSAWKTLRRSAYAALRMNIAEATHVIAGASATSIDSSGENYGVDHAYSRSKTSPYLGVVSALTPSVSAYASYTRIFNPQAEIDADNRVLEPIEGSTVEAGLKSEWLERRLLGSFAVFRAEQNNTAEAAGAFDNGKTYYEGIDATSTGFEGELTGELTPFWDIQASYTQFRLVDDDGHNAREFVPRRTFRLATSVQLPALPALKLGGALKYQSAISNADSGFDVRQGSYATLDLMAAYRFSDQLDLTVNLDNVTDKKYLTSLYWSQSYYAAPRSIAATLRWNY